LAPLNDTAAAQLALLLERRSDHQLQAPGPDDDELRQIFAAALRVPDFRRLRPYRFLAARGEGLDRLGRAMQRAAVAAGKPAEVVARAARIPHRAPLVIVAVASIKPDDVVPPFEQQLCAGCTVLAMQLAARALGYGGVWRSGWLMYDPVLRAELDLAGHEGIVGFLYLGTPAPRDGEADPPRPDPAAFVSWL
jgi:nitroreductase